MESHKYYVPQYIDEPFRIVILTMDELIFLLFPILFLLVFGMHVLLGICIGMFSVYGLRKLKGDEGHYFLFGFLYWHFPTAGKMQFIPPSYQREYIG